MAIILREDKERLKDCIQTLFGVINNISIDEWETERAKKVYPIRARIAHGETRGASQPPRPEQEKPTGEGDGEPQELFVKVEFYTPNNRLLGAAGYLTDNGTKDFLDKNGELKEEAVEGAAVDADIDLDDVGLIYLTAKEL